MTSSDEAATAGQPPTIYEWAGGRDAFRRWLDAFYDAVEGDELLAPLFGGKVSEEHRDHVTTWWCEVMGGPAGYTAHHGGYERMLGRHRGLAITPEQRLRFVTLLSRAADAVECPLIRNSGPRSWGTPSGARGSRWRTRSRAPRSPSTPPCRGGAGAWRRRTARERDRQALRGVNGTRSSSPGWTTIAVPAGSSCHRPGRSPSGSETTARASSENCWKRASSG